MYKLILMNLICDHDNYDINGDEIFRRSLSSPVAAGVDSVIGEQLQRVSDDHKNECYAMLGLP